MFWVYVLRCSDDSFYTGHTDCMEQRLEQHHAGVIASCYTFNRRPVELVYLQGFCSREEALAAERQIKGWSRAKKQAHIRQDWPEISRLARGSRKERAGND